MKPVEIQRSFSDCKMCNDIADMCNQIPDCSRCNREIGEWIDTVSSIFGTKAIVQMKDGSVKEFPISRIKVITKKNGELTMNTENESEKSMSFLPFRHCIREPHGSAVKFEILAATSNEFQVRYPDYDYIKMGAGPSVLYNREQLLCFLLAYDKAECLEFMEKLYHHMGWPAEKLYANPAFAGVGKEIKT